MLAHASRWESEAFLSEYGVWPGTTAEFFSPTWLHSTICVAHDYPVEESVMGLARVRLGPELLQRVEIGDEEAALPHGGASGLAGGKRQRATAVQEGAFFA